MRNLSPAAKYAMNSQSTDEVFVMLLTITGDGLPEPLRIASDPKELLPNAGVRGVVSRGDEYIFLPINVTLPTDDDTGIARARISIDNIGREIGAAIRMATGALSINIDIVLASNPDVVDQSLVDFRLERVTYDAMTVSGDLTVEYYDLEPFPSGRFTPSQFPGLF